MPWSSAKRDERVLRLGGADEPDRAADDRGRSRGARDQHLQQVEQRGRGVADRDHGTVEVRLPERDRGGACASCPTSCASAGTRSSRRKQRTSLSAGSRPAVMPIATMWASQRIGARRQRGARAPTTSRGGRRGRGPGRPGRCRGPSVRRPSRRPRARWSSVGLAPDGRERLDVDRRAVGDVVVVPRRRLDPGRHWSSSRSGTRTPCHGVTTSSRTRGQRRDRGGRQHAVGHGDVGAARRPSPKGSGRAAHDGARVRVACGVNERRGSSSTCQGASGAVPAHGEEAGAPARPARRRPRRGRTTAPQPGADPQLRGRRRRAPPARGRSVRSVEVAAPVVEHEQEPARQRGQAGSAHSSRRARGHRPQVGAPAGEPGLRRDHHVADQLVGPRGQQPGRGDRLDDLVGEAVVDDRHGRAAAGWPARSGARRRRRTSAATSPSAASDGPVSRPPIRRSRTSPPSSAGHGRKTPGQRSRRERCAREMGRG